MGSRQSTGTAGTLAQEQDIEEKKADTGCCKKNMHSRPHYMELTHCNTIQYNTSWGTETPPGTSLELTHCTASDCHSLHLMLAMAYHQPASVVYATREGYLC